MADSSLNCFRSRHRWLALSAGTSFPAVSANKDSGLLLRILHYHPTRVGRIPAQIDYADYRDVDGVKVPFRWTVSQSRGRSYKYQISQVQQNVPMEASQFEE